MWIRCVKWVRLSVIMTDASLPFEVRHSPIQGFGGYATRPIAAGTRIVEYAGERLTPEAAEARYPDVAGERHHTYLFAIDDEVVVDAAVNGNEARFRGVRDAEAERIATTHLLEAIHYRSLDRG